MEFENLLFLFFFFLIRCRTRLNLNPPRERTIEGISKRYELFSDNGIDERIAGERISRSDNHLKRIDAFPPAFH